MSQVQAILKQDPYYIRERQKEFNSIKTAFARQLGTIIARMPAPKRRLDLTTGEWEIVQDPQWQELIDRLTSQYNTYFEKEFPEFYQTKSNP